MSQFDRDKWNQRYAAQPTAEVAPPTELLAFAEPWLPQVGRVLDVAGGTGRNGWPLAERGLDVTIADISPLALAMAEKLATERKGSLTTLAIDLELDPFPAGSWDVIVQVCFLNRDLFTRFRAALAPGGILLVAQPTVRNLERHPKPPRPFLLEEGELRRLASELEILHYSERWRPCGRHEAQLIARRDR